MRRLGSGHEQYISWKNLVNEDWFEARLQQTRRHSRRRQNKAEKLVGLMYRGSVEPRGSADGPAIGREILDLLIMIGEAATTGVIGNVVYDILKRAAKRRRKRSYSILDHLTEREAAYVAAFALSVFRLGCGFVEDPASYHIRSIVPSQAYWVVLLSLTPHDAMPFKVTLFEGWDRKVQRIEAKIW